MPVDRPPIPALAMSIEEACASIGVSWKYFSEYVAPSLPVVRLGRRRLVPTAALEQWLLEHASTLPDELHRPGGPNEGR